jgi:hypothetical protein
MWTFNLSALFLKKQYSHIIYAKRSSRSEKSGRYSTLSDKSGLTDAAKDMRLVLFFYQFSIEIRCIYICYLLNEAQEARKPIDIALYPAEWTDMTRMIRD